ncbi:cellulase (glycosyl hydrolase family 5) [Arcticibacter tournemirensis]|nr:cellulase (glycosyl hydrolase family 5) [Arcticibacter tournemirensis]
MLSQSSVSFAQSTIYQTDFDELSDRVEWTNNPNASWVREDVKGGTCLRVTNAGMVTKAIDLRKYAGMKVAFRCLVKSENVSTPNQTYLGVKFMLHYKSGDKDFWKNQDNIWGTFDWKYVFFSLIIPENISDSKLYLGLQGSTGKAWFDNISVNIIKEPTARQIRDLGVNKSRTKYRGVMSPVKFHEKDLQILAGWNVNLIRWQLTGNKPVLGNNPKDSIIYNNWLDQKLNDLDKVTSVCKKYGIKVIVDLHSVPGGRGSDGVNRMFYDHSFNKRFIETWKYIAIRYKKNAAILGYDLVNEPMQDTLPPKGLDYYTTQKAAAQEIRKIDRYKKIFIETEDGASPTDFNFLKPMPLSNIVYEVHMYHPLAYTHQGVLYEKTGIEYPGLVSDHYYDKSSLRRILQPVRDFQLAYKVQIFVGEFSAVRWAPGSARYINDCIEIFEEYGWDWTYHAYREWHGWDVEYADSSRQMIKPSYNTSRKKVLLKWFEKNERGI